MTAIKDHMETEIAAPLHERLLGNDPRIREVNNLIIQLAQTSLTVLITGETGTGKDIVAKLLHKLSPRNGKPFVKLNCPSIPESIFESEFFGYERGAFTGAYASRPGRFELAHEGTIFLDEISEIPSRVQIKLLQVLDGEPFLRIGGTSPVFSNARVVAATNVPMDAAVGAGRLRKDVSFRLSEVVVHLPALRDRRDDIPLLAEHFNYNTCKLLKKRYQPLSPDLVTRLQMQKWPGNVRELAAKIKEYAATGLPDVLLGNEYIEENRPQPAPPVMAEIPAADPAPRAFISLRIAAKKAAEAAERALIEDTLRYTLWNRRKAAKLLKTSYSSLLRRIETYNIGRS
jgi:DNA-binding NtrC family response regulator